MSEPDHQFGRYRLLGTMGSGGMARLYLALMTGAGGFSRVVALKRVLPQFAASQDFIRMFVNEARLAAKLDHPNIIRTYEFGEEAGQYFIAMEYLAGEDLWKVLRRCRKLQVLIPIPIIVHIGQAIAEALQFAHDLQDESGRPLGLVHRDVNPSNVILTFHGITKLGDFGIAKATQSLDSSTRAGFFKGKFPYAAPEQIAGGELDARADVFALGIVLWELTTIRRLFARKTDAATIQAVSRFQVPSLSEFRNDVPHELDAIVRRALSRRPEKRYQSAGEMAEALGQLERKLVAPAMSREIRNWLIDLFGEVRANLKMRISQGRSLRELNEDLQGNMRKIVGIGQLESVSEVGQVVRRPGSAGSAPSNAAATTGVKPRAAWSVYGRSSSPGEEVMDRMPTVASASGQVPRGEIGNRGSYNGRSPSYTSQAGSFSSQGGGSYGSQAGGSYDNREVSYWSRNDSLQSLPVEERARRKSFLARRELLVGSAIGLALLLSSGAVVALQNIEVLPQKGLRLTSAPNNAAIYADGYATGKRTPAIVDVLRKDRSVRIRLELDGYAPGVLDVAWQGETLITRNIELVELGRLIVGDDSTKARLFIDGTPVTSGIEVELEPGEHELRIERNGRARNQRVVIRSGELTTVSTDDDK